MQKKSEKLSTLNTLPSAMFDTVCVDPLAQGAEYPLFRDLVHKGPTSQRSGA